MAFPEFLFGSGLIKFTTDTSGIKEGSDKAAKSAAKSANTISTSFGKGIKRGTDEAGRSVEQLGLRFGKLQALITSPAFIAAAGLGALTAGLLKAAKAAALFEVEIAKVATVVRGAGKTVGSIQKELLKLPAALGTPTELAKGFRAALEALGGRPNDAMVVLRSSALLSRIAFIDQAAAAKLLTSIINTYGLAVEDAAKLTDQLSRASELSGIEVGNLGQRLGVITPIARDLGISVEELFAAFSSLVRSGLRANDVISGLQPAFSLLIQRQDELRQKGIDLREVIGEKGLAGFLEELRKRGLASSSALRELGLSSTGLTVFTQLAGEGFRDFTNDLLEFNTAAGTALGNLKALQETATESTKEFQSELERLQVQLGLLVTPGLTELAGSFRVLIQQINDARLEGVRFEEQTEANRLAFQQFEKGIEDLSDTIQFRARVALLSLIKSGAEPLKAIEAILKSLKDAEDAQKRAAKTTQQEIDALRERGIARMRGEQQQASLDAIRIGGIATVELAAQQLRLAKVTKKSREEIATAERKLVDSRLMLSQQVFDLNRTLGEASLEDAIERNRKLLDSDKLTFTQRLALTKQFVDDQKALQAVRESAAIRVLKAAQERAKAEGRGEADLQDVLKEATLLRQEASKAGVDAFNDLRMGVEGAVPAAIAAIEKIGEARGINELIDKAGGVAPAIADALIPPEIDTEPLFVSYDTTLTKIETRVEQFGQRVGTSLSRTAQRTIESAERSISQAAARDVEFDMSRGAGQQ